MSDLYSRLGPQGRALVQGGAVPVAGGSHASFSQNQQVPQELDYLLDELRNPKPDTSVNKILGYMYHYLPSVKLEHNLRLLVANFLNNPVCFGPEGAFFEDNYQIIEAFKVITDKKLKTSQPTLSIKAWYATIYHELHNFAHFDLRRNCWKVLGVISGMGLCTELRDSLYTDVNVLDYKWFFADWDAKVLALYRKCLNYTMAGGHSDNIVNLGLLSLAVTYKRGDSTRKYTGKVSSAFLIDRIISLLFSNAPYSAQAYEVFFALDPRLPDSERVVTERVVSRPVVKHLNRLSFLLENLFEQLPDDPASSQQILESVSKILAFNRSLAASTADSLFNTNDSIKVNSPLHQKFWFFMKNLLFAECLVFQGVLSRFLISTQKPGFAYYLNPFKSSNLPQLEVDYRFISLKLLESLYHLNHILLSIGQGGFDSYNFVYYLSLELLFGSRQSTKELENLTSYLIGSANVNLHYEVLNRNMVTRCKVLFVLGVWENYLQQDKIDDQFNFTYIFPECISIVKNPHIQHYELTEACHSVLLFCFSKNKGAKNLKESLEYIDLTISQFPGLLSPHQLSIAVETLGKQALSSPSANIDGMYANSGEEFLEFINFKCFHTRSGIPIKEQAPEESTFTSAQPISEIAAESTMKLIKKQEHAVDIIKQNKTKKPKDTLSLDVVPKGREKRKYQFENRLVPNTSREALILAFINLIPYLPLSIFEKWLDKIFLLVDTSNRDERAYLMSMLWKILSENLDLNRCELAYRWWYQVKKGPSRMLGRDLPPGKF